MKIAIGSDHAGFEYKAAISKLLKDLGHDVHDLGTYSTDPVDYPLFIRPVALAVAAGEAERGIVLGGSGNGEAIVANRVHSVRCALCWSLESAKLSRQHNDANVLSLGARMYPLPDALGFARVFIETAFSGEARHARRLEMIADYEKTGELPPLPGAG